MRNTQRMLTVAGMTLGAAAVIGMGASTASAATVQDGKSTVAQSRPGGGDHPGGDGFGGGHDGDGRGDWRGDGRGDGRGGDGRWHGSWDGHRNGGWVQSWTVRTFPSKRACTLVGWIGEKRGAWDDSDCYRVGRGGKYVLVAHEYGGRRNHR